MVGEATPKHKYTSLFACNTKMIVDANSNLRLVWDNLLQ